MSEESSSPGFELSDYEHRSKAQYSTWKKNNCQIRGFQGKSRYSRETERISIWRNCSYSATDWNNALSLPGQLRYRSSWQTKFSLILTKWPLLSMKNAFSCQIISLKKGGIISHNAILLFVFSVKQLKHIEKAAQIIDVEHFQEKFNTAHVCPGGRIKICSKYRFIPSK